MKICIKRNIFIDILEYILLIIMIFGNYTMIERDIAYGVSESVLSMVFSCLCFAIFALTNYPHGRKYCKKDINKFIFVTIISVGIIIVPGSSTITGLIKWLVPVFCCLLYFMSKTNGKDIWIKYVNIVAVMALVSLLLYLFGSVLHIISPSRVAIYLYDKNYLYCNTYFGLQYEAQKWAGSFLNGTTVYRNCGIFIEAPMFNIVLCIAFAAECSFQKKPRTGILLILAITILTTFCTTGTMFLAIMICLLIFTAEKGNIIKTLKIFLVPLVVLIVIYFFIYLIGTKTQTVIGDTSYSVRVDHLLASLKMWIYRPIFGYGYGNQEAFYLFSEYDQGLAVGLPALLGRNGCLIFLAYFAPLLKRTIYSLKREKNQLFFWVGTFFCFFMTASIYKTIFIFLLCSQLMWKDDPSMAMAEKTITNITKKNIYSFDQH